MNMNLNEILNSYYTRQKLAHRTRFNLALVFSVIILLMPACKSLTTPLMSDENQLKMSGAIEESEAKKIVSKYVSWDWVENPYLMCQVNHLDQKLNTTRIDYNVKKNISYMDMVLYPNLSRDECLNVRVNQMDVFDAQNRRRTYYKPKMICCNINEERELLAQALVSLGARIGY